MWKSESHSSDNPGWRRNAETMSKGYQLAEVSLERPQTNMAENTKVQAETENL